MDGAHKRSRVTSPLLFAAGVLLSACATPGGAVAPIDVDPSIRGPVAGVGIEGQDIIAMTDRMMRDMLASPELVRGQVARRVIIDAEFFVNDSSQIINKNAITDRLRVNLNRASQGRMSFVGRQYARMVGEERDLKRQGVTDMGTTGLTRAQAGADFRLGGRIATIDSRNPKSGVQMRYTQITFSMVDLESGVLVWEGIYEFSRASADDIIYR
jgi:PBP1b-binding outer membrane lipoprotein LpoB